MTELKFETSKCEWDDGIWLCLKISKGYEHAAQSFVFSRKDKPYITQIKEYRKKRSLDANAYCWKLIGNIADALRTSKEEVYLLMLKRYGQGGMVSLEAHQVKQFERAFPYHEKAGEAVLNGKVFYHYRFWVGSSQYDTREMSILIDGIVDECKQMGLETWPPDQIALLKDSWQEAG